MPSGGKDVVYVSLSETGTVVVAFDVENSGPLPVRIDGLGGEPGEGGYRDLMTGLWMGQSSSGAGPAGSYYGELVRFEPFTMEPGELRYLALELTLPGDPSCAATDVSSHGLGSFPIRYSYLSVIRCGSRLEMPTAIGLACSQRPEPYPATDRTDSAR